MSTASPATTRPAAQSPVLLILKAVLLETVRRREIYVLLLLMGLFLLGAVVVRIVGVQNAATGTFLLNLGLTLAVAFAKLITLLTAARQFPDELEQRTLYPLLAKPLSRGQYLLGKWAASVTTGTVALAVLLLLAWLPVPRLETYSAGVFFQMLVLAVLSIGLLAALAILLSLLMPKMLVIVVAGLIVLAGGRAISLVQSHMGESAAGAVVRWVTGYLPDFSRLDLVLRYTEGLPPLRTEDFLIRCAYASAFILFSLALGNWLLVRRAL